MENNETWMDRFDAKFPPTSSGKGDYTESPIPHIKAFFLSELLSLADKIGAEKITTNGFTESQSHRGHYERGHDHAIDKAAALIKEMSK